jgi:hypothetical protein
MWCHAPEEWETSWTARLWASFMRCRTPDTYSQPPNNLSPVHTRAGKFLSVRCRRVFLSNLAHTPFSPSVVHNCSLPACVLNLPPHYPNFRPSFYLPCSSLPSFSSTYYSATALLHYSPRSSLDMPLGLKPNPFAKVTEETSEPEHMRRCIRARIAAERREVAKKAGAARKAKAAEKIVTANESTALTPFTSTSSTPKAVPKQAKRPPTAKSAVAGRGAPLGKKRSGLRGVALTFTHYGVKKVARRPSALLMQSRKVPCIPPLPGQEGKYTVILMTGYLLIHAFYRCIAHRFRRRTGQGQGRSADKSSMR